LKGSAASGFDPLNRARIIEMVVVGRKSVMKQESSKQKCEYCFGEDTSNDEEPAIRGGGQIENT
jgi:hypothetical protein